YKQEPKEFNLEIEKSIKVLEDIVQEKIIGFRAPHFSITEKSLWAVDILMANGIKYDSSVFPTKNFLYGFPSAPLDIYYFKKLIEFPLSVIKLFNLNIPFAGGFYFRILPYKFVRWSIKRLNEIGRPVCMYFHPWEFDGKQPRLRLPLVLKTIHYGNLKYTEVRFKKLLGDFKFSTIKEVLSNRLKEAL
ncbi:MAG: DUF3473 domain-containing protein, partial [Candidatus Omnitrophota bacterium]|nr:DUF3473 domain-containing protein [Candidatus Omnitrophota bacterium]